MNIRTQQLLSRIPDHPSSAALRQAALACLDVADRFRARETAVKSDIGFTPVGRSNVLKDEASKSYLPALQAAFRPIADALAAAKRARSAISIPAPDPSNIAAALERQEIRQMVKGMKPNDRMAFLTGSKDERIADAVLSAPSALSGLSDDQFTQVRDLAVDRRFGDRVAEIRAAEEAAEAAQAAMLVAGNEIKQITGVTDRQFEAMRKMGNDIPWLRNSTQSGTRQPNGDFVGSIDGPDRRKTVFVITPGETFTREATADEIARGKYYSNYHEYLSDHPGVRPVAAA